MLDNAGPFVWAWLDGKYQTQNYATTNDWGLIEKNDRIYVFWHIKPAKNWFKTFNTSRDNMQQIFLDRAEIAIGRKPKPAYILAFRDNEKNEIIRFKALSNPEDYSTF